MSINEQMDHVEISNPGSIWPSTRPGDLRRLS